MYIYLLILPNENQLFIVVKYTLRPMDPSWASVLQNRGALPMFFPANRWNQRLSCRDNALPQKNKAFTVDGSEIRGTMCYTYEIL